jgi:hypothetical protein
VSALRIYLADRQQHLLRPMPHRSGERAASQAIESTTAGRAFQMITVRYSKIEHPADGEGRYRRWVPLVEGGERLGVLELRLAGTGSATDDALAEGKLSRSTLERCRVLASGRCSSGGCSTRSAASR